jgi:NAD(P)-dependent dehydrogenase (short-subunit alcohol dehydrogenase family)
VGALDGRIAVVTGAGAGLGRAIAEALARAGAAVAVAELDAGSGERAAAELRGLGVEARAYRTDVSRREDVDATFEAVARDLGPVDVLVNNAGISRIGPHTQDVSDEDWHDSIAVMQTGVFFCMRAAGRQMLERGSGAIVNISSIRGFSANPGRLAYCAAKAAVVMMTRVTAGEWARAGVRVNAVCPGVLRTPMWDADVAAGRIDEEHYLELVPAGRLGTPDEVGALVVYLCSDAAAYVTGGVFTIDGGLTAIPAG